MRLVPTPYRGAVLFRAGRFNDALEHLNKAAKLQDYKRSSPAYGWYFLAMTHHKLGHQAEAKQWFDKAVECTDNVLDENSAVRWNRRLTLELLRSEAEDLLGIPAVALKPEEKKPEVGNQ